MLEGEILENRHIRPREYPNFLSRAYFHTPEGLREELAEGGLSPEGLYAVEGCIWFTPDLNEKWEDPAARERPESRERLLRLVRMTEQEPSLLGVSPHFLAVGRKP